MRCWIDRERECEAKAGLTGQGFALYDEQVGHSRPALCRDLTILAASEPHLRLLPVRSTVGQLPLEQHIGVRIPDGQPINRSKWFAKVR